VVLDELTLGSLELVTLISREPVRVSRIESLPVPERSVASLRTRFPTARIESLSLRVVPASAAPRKERP
jgi:hypothetical protein